MKSFSPRDIVVIVVSVSAALILAPVGVMAAAGQLVTITDPSTTSKARVDSGKLRIGDGSGVVTVDGTVKATDGSGPLSIDGTVATRIAPPTTGLDTINDLTVHAGDLQRPLFQGVGNKKVSLTSIVVSAEGANPGSVKLQFQVYVKQNSASGDCEGLSGFGAAERFVVMVPVGQTINLNFPSTLTWTQYADADDYYCINAVSGGGPSGYITHIAAYGFRS